MTKIDTNGTILAAFVEVNNVHPGPIATVGDGTLVVGYESEIVLMSEDLNILATLKLALMSGTCRFPSQRREDTCTVLGGTM